MKTKLSRFKKAVTLIVLMSMVFPTTIFLYPQDVFAQSSGGGNGGNGRLSAGVSTGTSIIGTAASCIFPGGISGAVKKVAQSIFNNDASKKAAAEQAAKVGAEIGASEAAGEATEETVEVTAAATTVPVSSVPLKTQAKVEDITDDLSDALGPNAALEKIKNNSNEQYKYTHCLNTIVHLITTKVIDRITLSTVDWINNGFKNSDGGDAPLWLENPGTFFENIAKEEINSVTGWYTKDPGKYPFGISVMSSILGQIQTRTSQNLQFSLNQVLAHGDYAAFSEQFSIGGWSGYSAFLEPQNNPFGNQLLVTAELGNRIRGTSINKPIDLGKQLDLSGGVLSPRECTLTATGNPSDTYLGGGSGYAAPSPLFLGEFYETLPNGSVLGEATFTSLPEAVQDELDDFQDPVDQADAYNNLVLRSRCSQWKQTTPGSLVANQLTTNINLQTNKLVNADQLNENLGLIFDALLNQLVQKGLKSLQRAENGGTNENNVLLAQVNNVTNDINPGSGFTYEGTDQSVDGQSSTYVYDIISGNGVPSQNLYNVQINYIGMASTAPNNALYLIDLLIPKIRALDYCVPGPNPRWITTAGENLDNALADVVPASPSDTPTQRQTYYANVINTLTGVTITPSPAIDSFYQMKQFVQNAFTKYQEKMLQSYSLSNFPPSMRAILPGLFNEIDNLEADRQFIVDYLANISGPLSVLQSIESALASIAANSPGGVLDVEDPAVQAQLEIFDSISDDLVTQTQLDDLLDQISQYQARIQLVDTNVNACIAETGPSYVYPNNRKTYTFPYFNYVGLPGATTGNTFLPGVNLGIGANDVNIEWNGVVITSPSNGLQTFDALLQSVY